MVPSASSSAIPTPVTSYPAWKPDRISFVDRLHAGRLLGEKLLASYTKEFLQNALYLGCVRGGMVIAKGVLEKIREAGLDASLDAIVVRKLSLPDNKEWGIGALTETGEPVFLKTLVDRYRVDTESSVMHEHIEQQKEELKRRQNVYREGRELKIAPHQTVIIIDDGIAGGGTMIAAIKSAQKLCPDASRIIVAVPVAHAKAESILREYTDIDLTNICVAETFSPPAGHSWNIDDFYHKFGDVEDAEVLAILHSTEPKT